MKFRKNKMYKKLKTYWRLLETDLKMLIFFEKKTGIWTFMFFFLFFLFFFLFFLFFFFFCIFDSSLSRYRMLTAAEKPKSLSARKPMNSHAALQRKNNSYGKDRWPSYVVRTTEGNILSEQEGLKLSANAT
jgi:hypothetical protein